MIKWPFLSINVELIPLPSLPSFPSSPGKFDTFPITSVVLSLYLTMILPSLSIVTLTTDLPVSPVWIVVVEPLL